MLSKLTTRNIHKSAGVRSGWYFRPLAILLPALLLGDFPQFPQLSLIPRAAAAAVNFCLPPGPSGPGRILQTCDVPASLEANAIAGFLQAHSIPANEANLLYQYGRNDALSELRAFIYANLIAIIKKTPSLRTPDEQATYDWIQNKVWQHQIDQYTAAVQDRNSWKSSPCRWKPDPDVAQQYGLTWDGSLWCNVADNLGAVFGGGSYATYPTKDYFLTAALKHTYGNKISTTVGWGDVLLRMQRDVPAATSVAVATGIALAAIDASVLAALVVGQATAGEAFGLLFELAAAVPAATAGPLIVVAGGVIAGALASYQIYNEQKTLQELATLDTDLNWVIAHKPSLESFLSDQLSAYKLELTFAENTLPDFPSAAVPPGRRSGDRNFVITPQGGNSFNSPTFTYLDWANTKWTANPSGGWISAQGVKKDNSPDDNFGVSIHFVDWNGNKYTASRNDLHFIVNKLVPATGDKFCPTDSSGNTPGDVSKCSGYVTDTLKLQDANGNKISVKFSSDPAFTSRNSFALPKTGGGQINITADGNPLPAIALTSSLPTGFSFSSSMPGSAQITDNGAAADGIYTFTLQASNATSVIQTVTVLIAEPVQILGTSDSTVFGGKHKDYYVPLGQRSSIVIAVGGSPTPALSCTSQQGNLTFMDNGDGTGTFNVNYVGLTRDQFNGGNFISEWCHLTANNSLTSDTATINFYPLLGPAATITSPTTVTFADNATYQLPVTASPMPGIKISFSFPCPSGSQYSRPDWLQLKDNGDGTAVLSGQPPVLGSSWQFALFASVGETPVCGAPNFTINVQHVPTLPQQMSYSLTPGLALTVTTLGTLSGGDGSVSGTLPPGVQFTGGPLSTWTLSGAPAIGSGGEYDMLYTATKADATASGIFKLFVLEAPQFIIQNSAIFEVGLDNSFSVNTTGFPKSSAAPGAASGTVGPMRISIQGNLPPGVTFTDTDSLGIPTGTGILSGKPAAGTRGLYPLTFTAGNGVGSQAIQNFTLQVNLPGDANNDGAVNCADVNILDAAYGTYRGNSKYDPRADLNSDGLVNSADLAIVEANMPGGLACPFTPRTITDLSNRVSVIASGLGRSSTIGAPTATITVTNTGSTAIDGPIQVIVLNLTPGVTVKNSSGYTLLVENTGTQQGGSPYITVLPTGSLAPGASVSVMVPFLNPTNKSISFTTLAVSGTF